MQDFLQGIGLFLCVGAIILVALAAIGIRSMTRGRTRDEDRVLTDRGTERPQYDDRDIETAGGFGGVPTTGPGARAYDAGDLDQDGINDDLERRRRTRDRDDDDQIRSGGGFGS